MNAGSAASARTLHRRRIARSVCIAVIAILGVGEAAAWDVRLCNQQPVRRADTPLKIDIMQCSAPRGSHRAADLTAGIAGWAAVPGIGLTLEARPGPMTCRVEINRRNEMAYVRPEQLDGARALTRVVFDSTCAVPSTGQTWPDAPAIVESDVIVADFAHDRLGPPDTCDDADPNAPLRRAVVLHEVGHTLGLLHEDDHMAVMNTASTAARYCGARAMEPHPDDRSGGRWLYPKAGPTVRDVAATAFHLVRPGYARPVTDNRHVRVCPGQPIDVRWSVANQGTVDTTTRVEWFVSDNDIISRHDRSAGVSAPFAIEAGRLRTETQRIIVPELPRRANGESGPWWLGYVVDPEGPGFELPATNDWTYTGLRLWLRDAEECP